MHCEAGVKVLTRIDEEGGQESEERSPAGRTWRGTWLSQMLLRERPPIPQGEMGVPLRSEEASAG
jgi:hypothetical protein